MKTLTSPPSLSELSNMTPLDRDWPFRVNGTYVDRFNLKRMRWEPLKGHLDKAGYVLVVWRNTPNAFTSRAHRVCWVTHHGPIPPGLELDHVDGDKTNNQITNLRLVTHAENIRLARALKGNWSEALKKLQPHQEALLLALQPSARCLNELAYRWGMSKFTLGNIRARAKMNNDPRYLGGL